MAEFPNDLWSQAVLCRFHPPSTSVHKHNEGYQRYLFLLPENKNSRLHSVHELKELTVSENVAVFYEGDKEAELP